MIFKQIGLDRLEAKNRHNDGLQHFALYGSATQHFLPIFYPICSILWLPNKKSHTKNYEKIKKKNEKLIHNDLEPLMTKKNFVLFLFCDLLHN